MKGSGLQALVCTVQGAGNCCVLVCSALRDKTENRQSFLLGRHLSKKGVKLLKMKDRRGKKREEKDPQKVYVVQ